MLGLVIQMVMMPASTARAEAPNQGADVAAGAASVIATLFAVPARVLACALTVTIGGAAYGLTMGTSEVVREELVAGTNSTCGGKYTVTPDEVKQFTRGTRPSIR
jgi:hypothetical protein